MNVPLHSTIDLDNPESYPKLDPSGMHERIANLPNQCLQAWEQVRTFKFPSEYHDVNRVVILGMGGSAIGGDLIADLATLENALPIHVCRDYTPPPGIGPNTLVIASSYSGETEETIEAFDAALSRNPKVIGITGEGALQKRCHKLGTPVVDIAFNGEPRSALGYSFVTLLGLLCNLGLISNQEQAISEAISSMQRHQIALAPESPIHGNFAKTLAQSLYSRLVVIYGAGILTGVARRWKTQINENAKAWAFYERLPELNHNALLAYKNPRQTTESAFVVLLKPSILHPRTAIRYQLTMDILSNHGVDHQLIETDGITPLAQMLSTIHLGDYTSYYLALLYGVNPSSVDAIDYLKKQISQK